MGRGGEMELRQIMKGGTAKNEGHLRGDMETLCSGNFL